MCARTQINDDDARARAHAQDHVNCGLADGGDGGGDGGGGGSSGCGDDECAQITFHTRRRRRRARPSIELGDGRRAIAIVVDSRGDDNDNRTFAHLTATAGDERRRRRAATAVTAVTAGCVRRAAAATRADGPKQLSMRALAHARRARSAATKTRPAAACALRAAPLERAHSSRRCLPTRLQERVRVSKSAAAADVTLIGCVDGGDGGGGGGGGGGGKRAVRSLRRVCRESRASRSPPERMKAIRPFRGARPPFSRLLQPLRRRCLCGSKSKSGNKKQSLI